MADSQTGNPANGNQGRDGGALSHHGGGTARRVEEGRRRGGRGGGWARGSRDPQGRGGAGGASRGHPAQAGGSSRHPRAWLATGGLGRGAGRAGGGWEGPR